MRRATSSTGSSSPFVKETSRMVATDGRRLALVDLEVEFPRSQEVEIIIPTKCVTELVRLVEDEGDVKMSVAENQVAFEAGGTFLVSKLVEGNYPNYRQVIPGEAKERITIETRTFPYGSSSRFAARQREVQFREARLLEEQHRDRREYSGGRRSARIHSGRLQGTGILHRL